MPPFETSSSNELTHLQSKFHSKSVLAEAHWKVLMILGRTSLNLLVRLLDSSLYALPTKLMGLKFFKSTGFGIFGMRARKVLH